ncbi:MAG: NUDIX hydrolase [Micrococcales bacterium]|nr:NUDIX hydrolase [Micrococcales bacterium]
MSRLFSLTSTPGIDTPAVRWLSGQRWEEAVPRRASTVMLVRDRRPDGGGGIEVFMLRRVSHMAFAPNSMVFPGGGVDPRDGEEDLPWAGPSPGDWAQRLRCTPAQAQMLVAAAVREVFEECGVLFAGDAATGPLADVRVDRWRAARDALIGREVSLGHVLRTHGLLLRSDLMVAKAHWITPRFEPRRFDTWFFAARMPEHQVADGDTSEADRAEWVQPVRLIESYAAGTALMLPPTVVCVEEIRDAASAAEFVSHADNLPCIMPDVIDTPDGPAMRLVEA